MKDASRSALSGGSPEQVPQDEEGKDANPEGGPCPHIHPKASTAPILVMEPIIATAISTSMEKDQGMDAVCVSTVTMSMETLNLKALSVAVGH